MKKQPGKHGVLTGQDILLGIASELAYPVALGLVAFGLAWLVVRVGW